MEDFAVTTDTAANQNKWLRMFKGDPVIWFMVGILMLVGIVEVYSATSMLAWKEQHGNTTYYLVKHLGFVFMGFLVMVGLCRVSYKLLFKASNVGLYISVVLLFLTIFTGSSTNDARRWFTIPLIDISFQTSDLAKLTLMIYLAKVLSTCQNTLESKKLVFRKCMIAILAVCVLILPSNLSTALLIGGTSVMLMLVGQIPVKWIGIMVGGLLLAGVLFIGGCKLVGFHTRLDTWVTRITTYSSSDADKSGADYQSEQSKIALSRGGILGQGVGKSLQRNAIPHPYSDFIFAIVVEETGLMGGIVVVACYIIFFFRCVRIVKTTERTFPVFIVVGLCLNIVLQAVSHFLVVAGIVPVTGQPLPFVSMGGTSLLFNSVSIGIILNISRYAGKKETVTEIEEEPVQEEIQDFPFMAG
ncbi:MAG: FtsW/RodA/SpoVE family cell cycle protein [Bacteroidales bacterium]|nr:FtsW/RodA/SpoVE family cell cycle protein [Bacteroidales bacterium]